jgi:hypothetical protein
VKAARKYAVTANALDAAAIAILFATFFAAHSLWNLIPAVATFVLLATRDGRGRAVVDSPRVDVHRRLGARRRLRDAGSAVDRREPSDSRSSRISCCSTSAWRGWRRAASGRC